MSVIASLVVGGDGSTSIDGSSRLLSTQADRERFLELHRRAHAIIIGSNTADSDPYLNVKVPVYLFSRNPNLTQKKPFTFIYTPDDQSLVRAVNDIETKHGSPVVIEAGVALLSKLIALNLIDELELSITPIVGGHNKVALNQLIDKGEIISENNIDDTRLLKCRYKRNTSHGEDNSKILHFM